MNFLTSLFKPAAIAAVWAIIQPFVLKLIAKNVPNWVTKLYKDLANYTQPALDSLDRLKAKVKASPNELDDFCLTQGINAIEAFANYLLEEVARLRA